MLIFDEGSASKSLVMVSGENQSAARNISLTAETSLTSFSVSKSSIPLVFGSISPLITISLSGDQRASKNIEFTNKFNKYVRLIPSSPSIPIGEKHTSFSLTLLNPNITGDFLFYLTQFSNQASPVIKDVPPITLIMLSARDKV